MYSLTDMIFTKSVSDEGERNKQDVGSFKLGQPLRGNRKWKVEKQRTLKYFINLPKDGPVCPHLGRAESHSSQRSFCLANA